MKLNYQLLKLSISIVFFTLISANSFAQFNDYSYKLGVQGNYLLPANEYEEDDGYLFRGFGRFYLSKPLDLEIGVGWGMFDGLDYGGNDYASEIIPIDLRLLISPFDMSSINPYLYLGGGGLIWWLDDSPRFPKYPDDDKLNGFAGLAELGLGTEIALSKNWILDLSAGFMVGLSDDINGLESNIEEGFLHEYDRLLHIGLGIAYVGESCDADNDNDGIGRCDEEKLGTDPNNPDSDGDGLNDGDELMKYKTDPLKIDSDGDGLADGDEVNNYNTDPNKADTDGDGLNDGDEVMKYKTDPLKADTDGDGLNDGDEVMKYKTDPNKADTDGDGLNDGEEVLEYKTDPLKADTDGDGLNDSAEVNKYKTDPLNKDTDGGSVDDGTEVNRGTDPLDASDDVEEKVMTFDSILFDFNKYIITKDGEQILKKALLYFQKNTDIDIVISGHTDNVGSKNFNQKLSDNRAKAVKEWLVNKGIDKARISTKGLAFDQPVAPNETETGRKQNRRAEIKIGEAQ